MKKNIIFAILMTASVLSYGQDIDNFTINGHYEVDYYGPGDFQWRTLDIDLYEHYGLKRDTVFVETNSHNPISQGIQVSAYTMMPAYRTGGSSNLFGVEGTWKQQVADFVYLNGGLALGFAYERYGNTRDCLMQIGIPLSVEFTRLDKAKASLFGSIGFSPTFYTMLKASTLADGVKVPSDKATGFFIAPRVDFGGYIPVGEMLMRMGVFVQYNVNCGKKENDLYRNRNGRGILGLDLGLVF